jgi:hypothetical protein
MGGVQGRIRLARPSSRFPSPPPFLLNFFMIKRLERGGPRISQVLSGAPYADKRVILSRRTRHAQFDFVLATFLRPLLPSLRLNQIVARGAAAAVALMDFVRHSGTLKSILGKELRNVTAIIDAFK